MEQYLIAAIPSGIALVGVVLTQLVSYRKAKQDREAAAAENRRVEDEWKRRLYDRLDRIDEKMDKQGAKLDKHNGFEGRIIALEVIAEWMQKEKESQQ